MSDVTLKDVARSLKLSVASVSRALKDHPHISDKTKKKVRAAVRRMGYVPNAAAQTIRRTRSSLVGFIVPDIKNEFYATVANVLSGKLAELSFQMILAITDDDPEIELRQVRTLREARATAVAVTLSASPLPETIRLLKQAPVIQFVRSTTKLTGPTLLIAENQATFAATRHLIDLGHRHIAFIGGTAGLSTGQERLAGFCDTLKLAGLPVAEGTIALGPPRASFGREAMLRLMNSPTRPSAVVVTGYELTVGAVQAAHDAGFTIPDDVSLIGYGDAGWTRLVGRGLSMIALPIEEIALTLTQLILREARAHGRSTESTPHEVRPVVFSPNLVLRGSTAACIDKNVHRTNYEGNTVS